MMKLIEAVHKTRNATRTFHVEHAGRIIATVDLMADGTACTYRDGDQTFFKSEAAAQLV